MRTLVCSSRHSLSFAEERRRRRFLALVAAGFVIGFAWLVLRPHETFYQGKPLSFWVNEAYESQDYLYEYSQPPIKTALLSRGTEALPALVDMAATRGSYWRLFLGITADDTDLAFLRLPPQQGKPEIAIWAFGLFGAEAKPAVPALARLLGGNKAWVQADAARCLGAIGPAAEGAVPALLAAFNSHGGTGYEDVYVRRAIAEALGNIGPAARSAIPAMERVTNDIAVELALLQVKGGPFLSAIQRLNDTSDPNRWRNVAGRVSRLGANADPAIPYLMRALTQTNVAMRRAAVHALGRLHQQPEVTVPPLISLLTNRDDQDSLLALQSLRHYGPAAKAAVPDIVRLLEKNNSSFRSEATRALRDIDPEAASRLETNRSVYVVSPHR